MKKLLITILMLGMCSHMLIAQQNLNNLAIEGTIKGDDGGRLDDAVVLVYRDGVEIDRVVTERNGRFDLYLDFNSEYTLEVSKFGYVSKKLYFNTKNIPEENQLWGYEYPGIIIDMIRRLDGVDYSILEKPVGKFYYEPNAENFVADVLYSREINSEINRLEAEQKAKIKEEADRLKRMEADYNLAIADAQAAMRDGDYLTAKDNLLAAQTLKPESSVPTQMLAEVNAKLNDAGAAEEQYLSLLATADQAFGNENYEAAIASYQKASEIKPAETYPKDRISKSKELMLAKEAATKEAALLADKDSKYNSEIKRADQAYQAGNFRDARIYYQNALALKSDDYPKNKLKEIEVRLSELANEAEQKAKQEAINTQYADKIDKADAAFNAGNYEMARTHYSAASELKPEEKYPVDQLSVIDQKLSERLATQQAEAERKALETQYQTLIASGDRLLKTGELQKSLEQFQAAAAIRESEAYPKEQIAYINSEIERREKEQENQVAMKEADALYKSKIDQANKLFNSGKYTDARLLYEDALQLKAGDVYAKGQISRIDAELQRQEKEKSSSQAYESAIAKGDEFFGVKNWDEALSAYTEASKLKPSEYYPKGRIAEISKIKDQELMAATGVKAKEDKQKAFEALIASGDASYASGDLKAAVSNYDQALRIQSDEYAKSQIEKINKQIEAEEQAAKLAKQQAEIDKLYTDAITRGDELYKMEKYAEAKESFNVAAGYKADEEYPKTRLAEIASKMEELDRQRLATLEADEKKNEYDRLIKLGNEQINAKLYEEAKSTYLAALEIFPNEEIPRRKLENIVELIEKDNVLKLQQQYQAAIVVADRAYVSKDYEQALELYKTARDIKPDETYPTERINMINELLVQISNQALQAEEDSRKRVIEETYDEGRTKVTIRKVMYNGKEDVYKRVIHSWGGKYYFLNEQPITELVWNRETVK